MSWLVGVDVGASHIESALAQEDADPVSRVRRSGTEVKPGRVVQAAEAIATTVDALVRESHPVVSPDRIVVGAAGTHTDALRTELEKTLSGTFQQSLVHVTTDGAIALKSAFCDRPGIIVSAGSGSIAYAKTPSETIQRVGGLGPKLADEGSGYAIGRAGLRAAARAADGRQPFTSLATTIQAAAGVANLDELIDWAWEADRPTIATLAETVCQDAQAKDETAQQIVNTAAIDLGRLVVSLGDFFDICSNIDVAFNGGVLGPKSPVRSKLLDYLRKTLPTATVLEQTVDPVLGALAMASSLRRP